MNKLFFLIPTGFIAIWEFMTINFVVDYNMGMVVRNNVELVSIITTYLIMTAMFWGMGLGSYLCGKKG